MNKVTRRVINRFDQVEYKLGGSPEARFAELCAEVAPRDKEWDVYDDMGKVITNKKISEYDRLVEIRPRQPYMPTSGSASKPSHKSATRASGKHRAASTPPTISTSPSVAARVFHFTLVGGWTLLSLVIAAYVFWALISLWPLAFPLSALLFLHLSAIDYFAPFKIALASTLRADRKRYGTLVLFVWLLLGLIVAGYTYSLVSVWLVPLVIWLFCVIGFGTANSMLFAMPPSKMISTGLENKVSTCFSFLVVTGWLVICLTLAAYISVDLSFLGIVSFVLSGLFFLHLFALSQPIGFSVTERLHVFVKDPGINKSKYGMVVFLFWFVLSIFGALAAYSLVGGALAPVFTWYLCIISFGVANSLAFETPSLRMPSFEKGRDTQKIMDFMFSSLVVGGWVILSSVSTAYLCLALLAIWPLALVLSALLLLYLSGIGYFTPTRIGLPSLLNVGKRKYGILVFSIWFALSLVAAYGSFSVGGLLASAVVWFLCILGFAVVNSLSFDFPWERSSVIKLFHRLLG